MDRSVEFWNDLWQKGQIGWHKDYVERYLMNYSHELFAERSNIKVLIPLCGKSCDITWISEQGHTVIGIEGSTKPIEAFFSEQSIPYKAHQSETLKDVKVYESDNGLIRIYNCDLFHFNVNVEGQFDAIWDVGSLVAISSVDRLKYAELLVSLMAPGCRCLAKTFDYNEKYFGGPPSSVPLAKVEELFGHACSVQLLEEDDYREAAQRFSPDFDYFNSNLVKILLK